MKNYVGLFTFCLLLVIANTSNPGFRTRITSKALNYASEVAINEFAKNIQSTVISNFEGKHGNVEYKIENIKISSFTTPSSSMTTQSAGIHWSASNAGMKVTADFSYKYRIYFFTIRDSGSIDVNMGGLGFNVVLKIERHVDGTASARTISCSASMGNLDITFDGGASWIYNMFKDDIADILKSILQPKICDSISHLVNDAGTEALADLHMTINLGTKFEMNNLLSSDVVYNKDNSVETEHKGEIFYLGSKQKAVVSNPPLPAVTNNSKMIYFSLSEYAISTLMWQAQNNNFLTYTFTQDDLEPHQNDFLNVACNSSTCGGNLFPDLQPLYPDHHIEVYMRSSSVPQINILNNNIHGELEGEVDLYAVNDSTSNLIARFLVNMSADASMRVQNEMLYGNMTILNFHMEVDPTSTTLNIPSAFHSTLSDVVQNFVNKQINSLMGAGVPLPVKGKVQLTNPSLQLLPHAAVISSNLTYL